MGSSEECHNRDSRAFHAVDRCFRVPFGGPKALALRFPRNLVPTGFEPTLMALLDSQAVETARGRRSRGGAPKSAVPVSLQLPSGFIARLRASQTFECAGEVPLLHLVSASKTQEVTLRELSAQVPPPNARLPRAFLFPSVFAMSGLRSMESAANSVFLDYAWASISTLLGT